MKKVSLICISLLIACCHFGCDDNSAPDNHVTDGCGNGVIETDEACDDGNTQSNDGCSADCTLVESGYTCEEAGKPCKKTSTDPGDEDKKAKCGNGIVETGEICDDNNTSSNDGCSADCKTIERR